MSPGFPLRNRRVPPVPGYEYILLTVTVENEEFTLTVHGSAVFPSITAPCLNVVVM